MDSGQVLEPQEIFEVLYVGGDPDLGCQTGTAVPLARERRPVDVVAAPDSSWCYVAPAPAAVHRPVDEDERGHLDPLLPLRGAEGVRGDPATHSTDKSPAHRASSRINRAPPPPWGVGRPNSDSMSGSIMPS